MLDTQVNPADFTDWSGLFKLLKESFSYMDDLIDPPSSFHQLNVTNLELKAREENFIIVKQVDQLIGCAFFKPLNDAMYVGKVAVSNQYRRQAVARKMVAKIEQLAIEKGLRFLELESRIELIKNHQTFAAMGFVKVGESAHPGYDWPTSISMKKRLERD